jgi:hypothetical protein
MYEKVKDLDSILKKYKEIKYYTIQIQDNNVNIIIQLTKRNDRKKA